MIRISALAVVALACAGAAVAQSDAPGATPAPVASAGAQPAATQQQPLMGPAPPWVTPLSLPPAPADAGDAPVQMLLSDEQTFLQAGRQTTYSENALKIETPAGLAAGNISLPWRPDTDVLTIHKLQIRRGDQVIDVLASGQTFTVIRREQNLDSAVLDGVLTANIQPEGLQVGDILDLAVSVTTVDPVLHDHAEQAGAGWNFLPITRAHMSVQWPDSLHVDQRLTDALPAVRLTHRAGMTRFDLALDNVQPIQPPKGAPARYSLVRMAEFTSFHSWSDLAALLAPLYAHAATLPAQGPLLAEVARIRDLSPDPKVRTQAALALVQDRIRYVALAMGQGGLVPADAETTWSRRFGDCKAKTALLLAILHALDIEAEPVVVSTSLGDGLDQHLPMIGLFNHVLVRATIARKTYWLDGTRTGDTQLDQILIPNLGWGLPIVAQDAALVRMQPAPLDQPDATTNIRIDASAGLLAPAPVHAELIIRGDDAVDGSLTMSGLAADARDNALRTFWRRQLDGLEVTSVSTSFDAANREEHFVMDGRVQMDWSHKYYEPDGVGVGYRADFVRQPGPHSDAPFAVSYPFYKQNSETIVLPHDQGAFHIDGGQDVDQTVAGIAYHRHAAIADNTFTVEETERSVTPEFPASDAQAAQASLRALADQRVFLVEPASYHTTSGDLSAVQAQMPADAAGFIRRGYLYMGANRLDDAITDFDHAVALDPHNALALGDRALAHIWKNELDAAQHDADAAAAIDPNNAIVFQVRGLLAQRAGKNADAIAAYTQALVINPGDTFSLDNRAHVYHSAGDDDRALADAAVLLQRDPRRTDLYLFRANIFRSRSDFAKVGAEGDALVATAPADDGYGHVVAARIYASAHRRDDAMHQFDVALAAKPEAYIYINRAGVRLPADTSGRLADIEAALHLEPNSADALQMKADLLDDQHDYQGAIVALNQAIQGAPNNSHLLTLRGVDYVRTNRQTLADADFAAARSHASTASALNDLCWTKATAGVALQAALADCDAALTQSPDSAAIIDSRGLVLLRLGRLDDAIAAYDRALSIAPRLPTSLYGRGLAWRQKGDATKGDADIAAATQIDDGVGAEFDGYGLHAQPSQASH
ncbi:MAG: tetratricopeptide repeat protein [Pseudomonadota bacterium]